MFCALWVQTVAPSSGGHQVKVTRNARGWPEASPRLTFSVNARLLPRKENPASSNRGLCEAGASIGADYFLFSGLSSLISPSQGSPNSSVTPGRVFCTKTFTPGLLPVFVFGPPIQAIQHQPGEARRPSLPLPGVGWGTPLAHRPSRTRVLIIITLN